MSPRGRHTRAVAPARPRSPRRGTTWRSRSASTGSAASGVSCSARCENDPDIEVVAVNDLTDAKTLAHLLKYDSVHGRFRHEVEVGDGRLHRSTAREVKVLAERDPGARCRGASLGVDVVVESTGFFTDATKAQRAHRRRREEGHHLGAGQNEDITIVMGVNDDEYDPEKHNIISQRLVHDELPRAVREGPARQLRAQAAAS